MRQDKLLYLLFYFICIFGNVFGCQSIECKDELIPNTFPNIQIKYKSTTKS